MKHFIPFEEQAEIFMEKFNLNAHPNSYQLFQYVAFKMELNYIAGQRDATDIILNPDDLRVGGTI